MHITILRRYCRRNTTKSPCFENPDNVAEIKFALTCFVFLMGAKSPTENVSTCQNVLGSSRAVKNVPFHSLLSVACQVELTYDVMGLVQLGIDDTDGY